MKLGIFAAAMMAGTVGAWSPAAFAFGDGAFWDGFYVDIYGGSVLAGSIEFTNGYVSSDVDAGTAFGASAGILTTVPGLAFEIDAMSSQQGYSLGSGEISIFTLMLAGEYAVPLAEGLEVYGGLGAGLYSLSEGPTPIEGSGLGYQAFAGVRAQLAEQVKVFAEVKHSAPFEPVELTLDGAPYDFYEESLATTALSVGLRFTID